MRLQNVTKMYFRRLYKITNFYKFRQTYCKVIFLSIEFSVQIFKILSKLSNFFAFLVSRVQCSKNETKSYINQNNPHIFWKFSCKDCSEFRRRNLDFFMVSAIFSYFLVYLKSFSRRSFLMTKSSMTIKSLNENLKPEGNL